MQAERDHLVRFVFPRLRQELVRWRLHLIDIDLRWGVTADQDPLSICRQLIDECRPRFIGILGDRYGVIPHGSRRSITADEIHHAVLDHTSGKQFAFFYFRDPRITEAMDRAAPGEFREASGGRNRKRLSTLKRRIIAAGHTPRTYTATWDAHAQRLIGLDDFGSQVYTDLLRSIESEFGHPPAATDDEYAEEAAAMEAFISERTVDYYVGNGQRTILDSLAAFAQGTGDHAICALIGPPGSGKSALVAKFCQEHAATHPEATLIPHFVGVGSSSTDLRRSLRRLCHELGRVHSANQPLPEGLRELMQLFPKLLRDVAPAGRTLVLVDGLNHLGGTESFSLDWLPLELPPNARIILTSTHHPVLDILRSRGSQVQVLELGGLSQADGAAVIERFLSRYGKHLEIAHRRALLGKADAVTPLYLLAALEELRTIGQHADLGDCIRRLPEKTPALFRWILKRLESESHFKRTTGRPAGPTLVRRVASLLGASRQGISPAQLAELAFLGERDAVPADAPDPQGHVAALLRLLRPYLMQRGELLDFYHEQFRRAVQGAYLARECDRVASHRLLARHFAHHVDVGPDAAARSLYRRALSELPHHLARARLWSEVEARLTNLSFIEAKCAEGMTHDLLRDYNEALASLPEGKRNRETIARHDARSRNHAKEMIAYARAWNAARALHDQEPRRFPLPRAGSVRLPKALPSVRTRTLDEVEKDIERIRTRPTRLERIRDYAQFVRARSHALSRFAGHSGFCVQDAYNYARTGPVGRSATARARAQTAALLLNASAQRPAFNPRPAVLQRFNDDQSWIGTAVIRADGTLAVAGHPGPSCMISIWDLGDGLRVRSIPSGTKGTFALAATPDASMAVTCDLRGTIRVLDLQGGVCSRSILMDPEDVAKPEDAETGDRQALSLKLEGYCLAITPDARRAVTGGRDGILRVWDLNGGDCQMGLTEDSAAITSVAISVDGRKAVAGTTRGSIAVWDLHTRQRQALMFGHSDRVSGVSIARDDRTIVSASHDGTLCTWDGKTGRQTTRQHTDRRIWSLSVSADRMKAITGGERGEVIVWDLRRLERSRTYHQSAGFNMHVVSVAMTPDGRRALSCNMTGEMLLWELVEGVSFDSEPRRADRRRHWTWIAGGAGPALEETWHYDGVRSAKKIEKWRQGHHEDVTALCLVAGGTRCVSGSFDGAMSLWDLGTGRRLGQRQFRPGHADRVSSLAASGRIVASGSDDGTVCLWDPVSCRRVAILRGHGDWVRAVAMTPDGKRLVAGGFHNGYSVWDVLRRERLHTLELDRGDDSALCIAPDGRTALVGSKNLVIWDLQDGRRLLEIEARTSRLGERAFDVTPDGRGIVGLNREGRLTLWDADSGRCIDVGKRDGPDGQPVRDLFPRVGADGRSVVTAGEHGSLCHWPRNAWAHRRELTRRTPMVTELSFAPDGRLVVAAFFDDTLRAWDLQSGQCIAVTDHGSVSAGPLFGRQGQIVVGTKDGTIAILRLSNSLQARAFVTPVRLWVSGAGREGRWGSRISAVCPLCQRRFVVAVRFLERIAAIHHAVRLRVDQLPCIELPDESWEDPGLELDCPSCEGPLRFNPFLVDRRGCASLQ